MTAGGYAGEPAAEAGSGETAKKNERRPLSERQRACLLFLGEYYGQRGRMPTQREIAAAMGLRSNSSDAYTNGLIAKDYLRKPSKRRARGIEFTEAGWEAFRLLSQASPAMADAGAARS